jgi:hypothetical protein
MLKGATQYARAAARIGGIVFIATAGVFILWGLSAGEPFKWVQFLLTLALWLAVAVASGFAVHVLALRAARRDMTVKAVDKVGWRRAQLLSGLAAATAVGLAWPLAAAVAEVNVLILVCGLGFAAMTGLFVYREAIGRWKTGAAIR